MIDVRQTKKAGGVDARRRNWVPDAGGADARQLGFLRDRLYVLEHVVAGLARKAGAPASYVDRWRNSSPTGPIMKEIKLLLMKLSFSSIGLMIFLESLTSGDRTIESCPLSDGHGYLPQDGGPAHFTWNPAWSAQNVSS
jgi:hypothetical protein